ncbi:MAG TPA: bifunctional diaminohydroxyphosphoribosylaminopyrimidine deaminase/5-amino-6-(5-phosphoribosylamino)uracil reductase RibD [Verrucomicrobiae bacterium]
MAKKDSQFMRLALRLARRGCGATSPNPMVGAALVKGGKIIGRGWHRRAGLPHAEIEALRDAQKRGHSPRGATLYVTLEPCCTHGRTPPCTEAIISAGIKKVAVGVTDPNPKHSGKGFKILQRAGIEVVHGILADECEKLNEAFNYWIIHRTPFVTVKAAMTLDGKIATASGESKWITGEKSRAHGMKLRRGSGAILVGINTILADNPSLTFRPVQSPKSKVQNRKQLRRIVLDSQARTPLKAKVASDEFAALTTIVVSKSAPKNRVAALAKKVNVLVAPLANSRLDLRWLLEKLGAENIASLLVEGGGEMNASFLLDGFAHRVAFFYAPKILGGRDSRKSVAGDGVANLTDAIQLRELEWKRVDEDLLMTALVVSGKRK